MPPAKELITTGRTQRKRSIMSALPCTIARVTLIASATTRLPCEDITRRYKPSETCPPSRGPGSGIQVPFGRQATAEAEGVNRVLKGFGDTTAACVAGTGALSCAAPATSAPAFEFRHSLRVTHVHVCHTYTYLCPIAYLCPIHRRNKLCREDHPGSSRRFSCGHDSKRCSSRISWHSFRCGVIHCGSPVPARASLSSRETPDRSCRFDDRVGDLEVDVGDRSAQAGDAAFQSVRSGVGKPRLRLGIGRSPEFLWMPPFGPSNLGYNM